MDVAPAIGHRCGRVGPRRQGSGYWWQSTYPQSATGLNAADQDNRLSSLPSQMVSVRKRLKSVITHH